MTQNSSELVDARNAGRSATPGADNPYAGRGALADMWRLGYQTMLLEMLNRSPNRQQFLGN